MRSAMKAWQRAPTIWIERAYLGCTTAMSPRPSAVWPSHFFSGFIQRRGTPAMSGKPQYTCSTTFTSGGNNCSRPSNELRCVHKTTTRG